MSAEIKLRPYQPGEAAELYCLYHATIRRVNRRDYTQPQVEAGAPDQPDMGRWKSKLVSEDVVVAEIAGVIVGFCSWDATGYLDFLYVHHAHQRQGIAQSLYNTCERRMREIGLQRIYTQASVTAQPFFIRQGFTLVKHQIVHVRGVDLPNAVMEKFL